MELIPIKRAVITELYGQYFNCVTVLIHIHLYIHIAPS